MKKGKHKKACAKQFNCINPNCPFEHTVLVPGFFYFYCLLKLLKLFILII